MVHIMIFVDALLRPGAMLVGLAVCIWGIARSRKIGYAIVGVYFALRLFSVLAGPTISQMMVERQSPELLELQETREQAERESVEQPKDVLQGDGAKDDIWVETEGRVMDLDFVPVFLVIGLWLVVRKEGRGEFDRGSAEEGT
jgi:hypothetical protein